MSFLKVYLIKKNFIKDLQLNFLIKVLEETFLNTILKFQDFYAVFTQQLKQDVISMITKLQN